MSTSAAHERRGLAPAATYAVALVWGMAEATWFFIVPDVWITRAALHSRARALGCSVAALVGSLGGGALLFVVAARNPDGVHTLLLGVPAINQHLLDATREAMDKIGGLAIVAGSFGGLPYKLFAANAGETGMPLWRFMLLTIPARGIRFVLLALVSNAVAEWFQRRTSQRVVLAMWLAAWAVVYLVYWTVGVPGFAK